MPPSLHLEINVFVGIAQHAHDYQRKGLGWAFLRGLLVGLCEVSFRFALVVIVLARLALLESESDCGGINLFRDSRALSEERWPAVAIDLFAQNRYGFFLLLLGVALRRRLLLVLVLSPLAHALARGYEFFLFLIKVILLPEFLDDLLAVSEIFLRLPCAFILIIVFPLHPILEDT